MGIIDACSRFAEAQSHYTSPERLAELANDEIKAIRLWVARNPSTPQQALAKLALDSHASVRAEVVQNPETPIATLKRLRVDPDAYIRYVAREELKERRS